MAVVTTVLENTILHLVNGKHYLNGKHLLNTIIMNRLVVPNGGMPLEGDDFDWIQNGAAETFKGVFKAIADLATGTGNANTLGNFIIAGCEVTDIGGGNSSISEGYVFIDGEILYTPAIASISNAQLANAAYIKHIYYDPAGQEVMQNGNTEDTYEVRRAELKVWGAAPNEATVYINSLIGQNRYLDILTGADVFALRDVVAPTTMVNSWTTVANPNTTEPLLITKQFGRVNIRGPILAGTLGGAAFTLSAGFRPKIGVEFLCPYGDTGIVKVAIATSGQVEVYQVIAPGSGSLVPLDGITFTIE